MTTIDVTVWCEDPPPSASTSCIVGCMLADLAIVGDTTDCNQGCEPEPAATFCTEEE